MGKIIFLVGEIVVSCDNLGAKTASACPSTQTKITCSHVFVDEILGTWRARSPQNQPPAGVRTLGWGVSRWGKMMFLVGEIVVSLDNLGAETASACPSTETKITCSHVFVDEILGAWRAGRP